MDITILLARVFGVYLLIGAAAVFLNRKALIIGVTSMFKERFAELMAALMAILAGLFYVNLYQDWSSLPTRILSLIGWLILAKGLLLAVLPQSHPARIINLFNQRKWYVVDGLVALAFGLYLTGVGFGWW